MTINSFTNVLRGSTRIVPIGGKQRLQLNPVTTVLSNEPVNLSEYTLELTVYSSYQVDGRIFFCYIDAQNHFYLSTGAGTGVFRVLNGVTTKVSYAGMDRVLIVPRAGAQKAIFRIYFKNDGEKINIMVDRDGFANGAAYEAAITDTQVEAVEKFKNGMVGLSEESAAGSHTWWFGLENIVVHPGLLAVPDNFLQFIHVATTGSNLNTGGIESPVRTIARALELALPGSVIKVKAGVYNESIVFKKDKLYYTESSGITIKAEGNAVITGVDTTYANNLTIHGFEITGQVIVASDGVNILMNYIHDIPKAAIYGGGEGNFIGKNHIYRCNKGIVVSGKDWVVYENDIERLVRTGEDCDYMRVFGSGHVIKNNYMHGTLAADIGASHVDLFQTYDVDGVCLNDVIFEGNHGKDCYHQAFMCSTKQTIEGNVVFRNNIFEGALAWGLCLYGLKGVTIQNNIFYNIAIHGVGVNYGGSATMTNNIFYNAGSAYWGCGGGGNVVFSTTKIYKPESFSPTDFVNVDPQFIPGTFKLQQASPVYCLWNNC